MPDNLSDLFRRNRDPERPSVYEGTVASGAGGLNGTVTVTIDAFDGGQQRWPVDGWNPRGDTYPKRGDRCLVTLSDSNRLWLLQWAPGGGGRGPGGRDVRPIATAATGSLADILVGTPRDIIEAIVLPIGTKHGLHAPDGTPLTPESIERANNAHSDTSSTGNVSDHAGPGDQRWAADMGQGTSTPTQDMLNCAEELAAVFHLSWSGSGSAEDTKHGYNYQLIANTAAFGGHLDHDHFGIHVV